MKLNNQAWKDVAPRCSVVGGFAGAGAADIQSKLREFFTKQGTLLEQIKIDSDVGIAKILIKDKKDAVLVAGTGSVCFGTCQGGGYGWKIGDEGSGYYIGKLALVKALEQEKGDGDQTALLPAIKTHFQKLMTDNKVALSADSIMRLHLRDKISPAELAAFAPTVFDLAYKGGDAIAKAVIDKATQELADLVRKAMKQELPEQLYLIGGAFKNNHAPEFIEKIKKYLKGDTIQIHNISQVNTATFVMQTLMKAKQSK